MRSQNEPVPYANTKPGFLGQYSIGVGWYYSGVFPEQRYGIQLDIYIISYWVWCTIYIFGTSMYWCRSLAKPTEPNWRWKIWNHVKADEYGCDNRMWKLCRSWPSFLQTIRCANCEVPLCNRKACWRHHVHAPLARSNTHAPPIARWCHRCFWFRTHNSTQKSLGHCGVYLSLSIIDVMVLAFFCQKKMSHCFKGRSNGRV